MESSSCWQRKCSGGGLGGLASDIHSPPQRDWGCTVPANLKVPHTDWPHTRGLACTITHITDGGSKEPGAGLASPTDGGLGVRKDELHSHVYPASLYQQRVSL